MKMHPLRPVQALAIGLALLAGLGEFLALQSWRVRDRLARTQRLR